jgi:hypothetical protein
VGELIASVDSIGDAALAEPVADWLQPPDAAAQGRGRRRRVVVPARLPVFQGTSRRPAPAGVPARDLPRGPGREEMP